MLLLGGNNLDYNIIYLDFHHCRLCNGVIFKWIVRHCGAQHNGAQHNNGAKHNGAQQQSATQWSSTTVHNTMEHNTTQWSTAPWSKIRCNTLEKNCQYVCSSRFVNHETRDLLWCELTLCIHRNPLDNWQDARSNKYVSDVCDFSFNMTVGPVSSSREDILKSRDLRFACIHKEPWMNCSQTYVDIADHV